MRPTRFPSSPWPALALVLALAAVMSRPAAAGTGDGERVSELLSRGESLEAVSVHPRIHLVSGNSNAYLVNTPDGAVLVDTGLNVQAARTREALLAHASGPVRKLVLTHAHSDHLGGAPHWDAAGVEIIAARDFPLRNTTYRRLRRFQARRSRVLWADVMPEGVEEALPYPDVSVDVLVAGRHDFELGGIRFEVYETPGGEGPDAVSVWVPAYGALFSGDALGPTAATFPNLFTLRGENPREVLPLLATLERMRALAPELLLPGHFAPLRGRAAIDDVLARTEQAVRHVHDATIEGMNAGKDVWTLMREIALPEELGVSEQYGRVPWGVRAIWEAYTGWFKYESTTELYATPPRAVYPELAELAGGPDRVAARARARAEAGAPLEALHLAEVALAAEPAHRGALEARLAALRLLEAEDGGSNFQVAGWLRHRIAETRRALGEEAP